MHSWDDVIQASEALLAAMAEGRWGDVGRLQDRRKEMLRARESITSQKSDRPLIERAVALNTEIVEAVQNRQHNLRTEQRDAAKAAAAAQKYDRQR